MFRFSPRHVLGSLLGLTAAMTPTPRSSQSALPPHNVSAPITAFVNVSVIPMDSERVMVAARRSGLSGDLPKPSVQDELMALVRAGLTPYQALTTGTRNAAAYFGTLNESGTVTVGKRADLVLLDGNPLTDIRQTASLAGVMLGGRWLPQAELDRRVASTTTQRLGIRQ